MTANAIDEHADHEEAAAKSRWSRMDSLLETLSEKLNPILVKESRQALKSKQFVITFMIMLMCGWGWSVFGIALQAGSVYYAESGQYMLNGYFIVLVVPLLVIVPFAAFRAIASERDYGTFELLSITSLNARQIVTGKLAVAVLQILIYFSTIAPFVAFTYLLRGVDLIAIFYVLGWTLLLSLLFSSAGILIGALSRSVHWQVAFSIVLLGAVAFATMLWVSLVLSEIFDSTGIFQQQGFWEINGFLATILFSYVVVFVLAAAARVSFASDNRSSAIRIALMLQQAVFLAGLSLVWMRFREATFFLMMVMMPAASWGITGALMTAETEELSARVKRSLPQSALGRVFLTWFFPGSGTGYVFAVSNYAALVAMTTLVVYLAKYLAAAQGALPSMREHPLPFGVMFTCYLAAYLGVGRLLILWTRRRYAIGLVGGAVIQFAVAILGAALPAIFQLMLFRFFGTEYTSLQAMNWMWTLGAMLDGELRPLSASGIEFPMLIAITTGGIIFLINLALAAGEIRQIRAATPQRVAEDSQSVSTPDATKAASPWDESE